MPDRTPPRHDCPNCGPDGPGPSTTETVRGGRRLRTPGRTKTGPTIATAQISMAATTDTTRDNNPACDVLRMRLTRVLDECRSTYIPGDQAALVLAELAPELDELADYRNRITWETTCGGCAKLLDSFYAETVRREEAESQLAEARATNRRLNYRAQAVESRLNQATVAVANWQVSENGTYVPLSSLDAIAKALGVHHDTTRWELHYQRVADLEAKIAAERERQDRYEEEIVGRFNQQAINLSRRAEQAEAAIARVEAELDRTDRMLGTDGETFRTAAGARIHAQRIRAALNPPADPVSTP